ncbi:DNA cytosine methyltransferase [Streptomyces sp. SPB78]|uniref:DNA cytosine methyltransferase n=1 Tax=Streptomyces sp. (strain SPB78) TaxID=591157 RepID=UPI00099868BF|nr:DNA cytosine methyltransferase [Streptomyces sp. SPB78]
MSPSPTSLQPVENPQIIDLFAGPGGLDIAAKVLGIPSVGIELDDDACATRTAAGLVTKQGDVCDFSATNFPAATVLTGGPPCQTYTVAGNGAGRQALDNVLEFVDRLVDREDWNTLKAKLDADFADKRTGLVLQPLRWALDALDAERPYEAIVLEQVPAVLPVWQAYAKALAQRYHVWCGVLHTEEFGVPQTRRRAVLLARLREAGADDECCTLSKTGPCALLEPRPTHQRYRANAPRPVRRGKVAPWISMGKALHHLRGDEFVVVSNYGSGGDPKKRGRRTSNEPSATVTGKISRNRIEVPLGTLPARAWRRSRFSNQEAGHLQTFPLQYPWSGRAIAQQIGNAVPPRFALHILCTALALGKPEDWVLTTLKHWDPERERRVLEAAQKRAAVSARVPAARSAISLPRTGA